MMKSYVLIFRMDITTESMRPSQAQMQKYMANWNKWIDSIVAKGELAEGGNHLSRNGAVLKGKNGVTKGPYTANKESVAGYIIILAKDLNEAISIAERCPILQGEGTSVEVRETAIPG